MTQSKFNEKTRVQAAATIQFLKLGYEYQPFGENLMDKNTKIFKNRFVPAIEQINGRKFSEEEINNIISEIHSVIQNDDSGQEFYRWLCEGRDGIRLIDFNEDTKLINNDFAVSDEFIFGTDKINDEKYFRPDIVVLINGIPLSFMEVKSPENIAKSTTKDGGEKIGINAEYDRMVNQRLLNKNWKKFFNMLQVVSFSNNMEYDDDVDAMDITEGSFYSTPNGPYTTFQRFREKEENYHEKYPYKFLDDKDIKKVLESLHCIKEFGTPELQTNCEFDTPCNKFVTSVYDKERFLFFLQYGILYVDGVPTEKQIMRYQQFFAARKVVENIRLSVYLGIIWHGQGSGKTALSAFLIRILKDFFKTKNINTRFYFIVDRLGLVTQASMELQLRGFTVYNPTGKDDCAKILSGKKTLPLRGNDYASICVTNIQKFPECIEKHKSPYEEKIQDIFFVDEAHRSYSEDGQNYYNLLVASPNAIRIALTGTPLLRKGGLTTKLFGPYIDKYFYDESIKDRSTLPIKKEKIDIVAKTKIRKNLHLEDGTISLKDVAESDDFINAICSYINDDFICFRIEHEDGTVGAMIICMTDLQVQKVADWFNTNSEKFKGKIGAVFCDPKNPEQARLNEEYQHRFRKGEGIDILVVNQMLTVGFDARRLKRAYLLRTPHDHTLLQSITRVNRLYIKPDGSQYEHGYVVDFADIDSEFEKTMTAYTKEIENEVDGEVSLTNMLIDIEAIKNQYESYCDKLVNMATVDNLEIFYRELSKMSDEKVQEIKKVLINIQKCLLEFRLSHIEDEEYLYDLDKDRVKKMLGRVQNHINYINIKNNPVHSLNILGNKDVVSVKYQPSKSSEMILNMDRTYYSDQKWNNVFDDLKDATGRIKNIDDKRIIPLDQMLRETFNRMSIRSKSEPGEDINTVINITKQIEEINHEYDEMAKQYGGNYDYVKTYYDVTQNLDVNNETVKKALDIVFASANKTIMRDSVKNQTYKNFVAEIKKKSSLPLYEANIYNETIGYGKTVGFYDDLLSALYKNIKG